MSLFKYFKPVLPSPAQTGIGERVTAAVNKKWRKSLDHLPVERGSSMRPTWTKIEAE